jgi:hypothetical protein
MAFLIAFLLKECEILLWPMLKDVCLIISCAIRRYGVTWLKPQFFFIIKMNRFLCQQDTFYSGKNNFEMIYQQILPPSRKILMTEGSGTAFSFVLEGAI